MKSVFTAIFLILFFIELFPQENNKKLAELSLEELLNMEITVASKKALTTRESPGIVSVVTADDIEKSGARDLIDVLRLLPGFEFGVDVEGVVGAGLRGIWGHEGKILMLVDGQELNENLFSTLQFGNHIPVEHIKRIEIIRGPGSAIYGGYAELSVINILTKSTDDLDGFKFSANYGHMKKTFARRGAHLSFGKESKDLKIVLQTSLNQANRSDKFFTDFDGNSFDMTYNSRLNNFFLNTSLGYKNFSGRFIVDEYFLTNKDQFFVNLPDNIEAVPTYFSSYFAELKYEYEISGSFGNMKLIPKFNFKRQRPWAIPDQWVYKWIPDSLYGVNYFLYDLYTEKYLENFTFIYDPNDNMNFVGGLEAYQEYGYANNRNSYFVKGNAQSVKYNNIAFFGQGLWVNPIVNITVGARYENHESFGSSFVPRIAFNKIFDKLHLKALYSFAFRAPGIKNIDGNPTNDLKPEKTNVLEVELGYQLTENIFLTANAFQIQIKDPIIYFVDTTYGEGYRNFDKTGTMGFEVEFLYRETFGSFNLNYSYYKNNKNNVSDYTVLNNENALIGFPQHKLNFFANIKLFSNFSINPSLTYLSKRYGYKNYNGEQKEFDPVFLMNLNFLYKNIAETGLDLSFGIYDIFESKYSFIQPYFGSHAELPGPSREFLLKLSYSLIY